MAFSDEIFARVEPIFGVRSGKAGLGNLFFKAFLNSERRGDD